MEQKMMPFTYDGDMNVILDSVLNDIDDMMLTQTPQPTYTSSSYYSPFYCAATSNINYNMDNNNNHSFSSFIHESNNNKPPPICSVDRTQQTPSTSSNSPVSPSSTDSIPKLTGSTLFKPDNYRKLQLKDYIYISKDSTHRLSQYVVRENWGKDNVLLYKYLDYIFRCQSFNKQIIRINHKNNNKNIQYLLFHSGLQRKSDNQFLFVLLIPNNISTKQHWMVQIGGIQNSFLSKKQLLHYMSILQFYGIKRSVGIPVKVPIHTHDNNIW